MIKIKRNIKKTSKDGINSVKQTKKCKECKTVIPIQTYNDNGGRCDICNMDVIDDYFPSDND